MIEAIDNKRYSSAFKYGWPTRYGIALVTVIIAWAARALLSPVLPSETVYMYFVPSVLISAWLGGVRPGLAATALSIVAADFLLPDAPGLTLTAIINGFAFVIIGIGVSSAKIQWSIDNRRNTRPKFR